MLSMVAHDCITLAISWGNKMDFTFVTTWSAYQMQSYTYTILCHHAFLHVSVAFRAGLLISSSMFQL